jgi:hypothetical protein
MAPNGANWAKKGERCNRHELLRENFTAKGAKNAKIFLYFSAFSAVRSTLDPYKKRGKR